MESHLKKNRYKIKLVRPLMMFISIIIIGCNKVNDKNDYKFGVVAPFSGQEGASVYGNNIKNGVELAVNEINSEGGINGKMIRPVYEDSQLKTTVAVGAVQKLINDNVNIIIGPVASSSTIAASKIVGKSKTILISPSSTASSISGISPWVFRTIAPDIYEGEVMAKYAFDKGYRRIGVAFVDNAGTKGPALVFKKVFSSLGGKIIDFEVIPQGVTDVRVQVSKLAEDKPDAVYLLGYALELGAMIKQYREQNINTPILSFQVMEESKVIEIAGKAAEGVVFTTPTIYEGFADENQKKFIDQYKNKYGELPGIFAANAYDAVKVMVIVLRKNGFNSDKIRKGLINVRDYIGASGVFDINKKGDTNQKPRLMVIEDRKIKLLK